MKLRRIVLAIFLCFHCSSLHGKDLGYLNISLTPGIRIPVAGTNGYFKPGGGGGITLDYTLPTVPILNFRLLTGTWAYPIVTADSMVITSICAGPGFNIELPKRVSISG